MRFWIGKEREGRYKGIKTLFVQSEVLDDKVMDKMNEILKTHSVGQIYFGAGSTQVNVCTDYSKLKNITNGIFTSVECFEYQDWYEKCFEHIILNVKAPLGNKISLKVRSQYTVSVLPIETGYDTCLDDLHGDLFLNDDEEIYKEN